MVKVTRRQTREADQDRRELHMYSLAERFKAGESVEEFAKDYGQTALGTQESLRCELPFDAA